MHAASLGSITDIHMVPKHHQESFLSVEAGGSSEHCVAPKQNKAEDVKDMPSICEQLWVGPWTRCPLRSTAGCGPRINGCLFRSAIQFNAVLMDASSPALFGMDPVEMDVSFLVLLGVGPVLIFSCQEHELNCCLQAVLGPDSAWQAFRVVCCPGLMCSHSPCLGPVSASFWIAPNTFINVYIYKCIRGYPQWGYGLLPALQSGFPPESVWGGGARDHVVQGMVLRPANAQCKHPFAKLVPQSLFLTLRLPFLSSLADTNHVY